MLHRLVPLLAVAGLATVPSGCGSSAAHTLASPAPSTAGAPANQRSLARAESVYQAMRYFVDQADVTRATARKANEAGLTPVELDRHAAQARDTLMRLLAAVDTAALGAEDRRAVATMRVDVSPELYEATDSAAARIPDCTSRTTAPTDSALERALTQRMLRCYSSVVHHIVIDGQILDRLTILDMLEHESDPKRREEIFRALGQLWQTINGDGGADSPYRRRQRLNAPAWADGHSPADSNAIVLGVRPEVMQRWLTDVLETWRANTPDSLIEPWDYYYVTGRASRVLSPRVTSLLGIDTMYYKSLGADIGLLGVHFDLALHAGKTPVAETGFGARPRCVNGKPVDGQPWVFATYQTVTLDNLDELMHETGHAIHIASICTRPAFADWPDNTSYTEALAELIAEDVNEPTWQRHWLGDSLPTRDALEYKYSGAIMDIAWALFEVRVYGDPTLDPNVVWGDITERYLHIRRHPELSWWAARAQLIDAPGYLMNYAIGAIIVADLRARMRQLRPMKVDGDPGWYDWIWPQLYRWGLEKSSQQVIEDFLGRPLSPDALLADIRRMGAASAATR
ncbi:MAG TPA: hypothetical protein VEI06_01925 [Gemmatimonadaceae bacterium]|nr:hypothetical protein [Gemmatimonadaceae bacterium]